VLCIVGVQRSCGGEVKVGVEVMVREWPKVQVFGVLLVGDSRSLAEGEQGQSRWQSQQAIELHADLSKLGRTAHKTCDLVGWSVVSEVRFSLSHA
jgi:hypothetical protein